ncbi:sensor histidine kinase [Jatrophihabitans endophyticus]|uniref:sensor histidine kinase n=1 Tax=Jatrophihabitans endophyticus TaxID=1206085 RepID=UPI0019F3BCB8|nr:histidine kinase [Jatrophihabitans endophyticus]MBE7189419.1 hypothetical protein [Jatrophihabitans endophyticus]
MRLGRLESWTIVLGVLLVTVVPEAVNGWPDSARGTVAVLGAFASGLLLVLWRQHPLVVTLGGGGLLTFGACLSLDLPNLALVLVTALALTAAHGFGGRGAWVAASAVLVWLVAMYWITGERDAGLVMFTVPGFVAGTALRLRRETADELALRGQELDAERELFSQLAVRNERARIAAELHDIIGHSLSVMVVQAAAGQRLIQAGSATAGAEALAVVAESARQGREDLGRLVELLGGQDVVSPDLAVIDEVVALASGSGLRVTCHFEGDRDGVSPAAAGAAFRVVRESLTNALRYAPGSSVRVLVHGAGRSLSVRVENDAATTPGDGLVGTGSGLRGLRELVEAGGGKFAAGPRPGGGWLVEASVSGV